MALEWRALELVAVAVWLGLGVWRDENFYNGEGRVWVWCSVVWVLRNAGDCEGASRGRIVLEEGRNEGRKDCALHLSFGDLDDTQRTKWKVVRQVSDSGSVVRRWGGNDKEKTRLACA